MLEIFTYDFIARAIIVGSCTAIAAALIGNFVVAARQAIISDMLAHASLGGVGIGILFHFSPIVGAFFVALLFGGLLWFLTSYKGRAPEAVSMILLTGGLAVALLCAHLAKGNPISFDTYLFGSLLTISHGEMIGFLIFSAIVCVVIVSLWQKMVMIVFDPQFARTRIGSAWVVELFFMCMIAMIVTISLKVIGGLLIGALFVIPVLCAHQHVVSFRGSVIYSMIYGLLGVWGGIMLSYYFDVPTSSSVVLLLIGMYLLLSFVGMALRR